VFTYPSKEVSDLKFLTGYHCKVCFDFCIGVIYNSHKHVLHRKDAVRYLFLENAFVLC